MHLAPGKLACGRHIKCRAVTEDFSHARLVGFTARPAR